MGDDCEECLSPMPTTHYHYEEEYAEEYAPTPHPRPPVDAWEKFIREATANKPGTTPAADPTPAERVSKRHMDMQVDGSDFVCNACGAVSGDFDLFEEVGAEVNCKSVEEPVAPEKVSEKDSTYVPTVIKAPGPITFTRKPATTTMSKEIIDMYKKLMDDIATEEKNQWASAETHVERKSYTELAKEFRTAKEDPENQKKWYSDVMREMQRRERRR